MVKIVAVRNTPHSIVHLEECLSSVILTLTWLKSITISISVGFFFLFKNIYICAFSSHLQHKLERGRKWPYETFKTSGLNKVHHGFYILFMKLFHLYYLQINEFVLLIVRSQRNSSKSVSYGHSAWPYET